MNEQAIGIGGLVIGLLSLLASFGIVTRWGKAKKALAKDELEEHFVTIEKQTAQIEGFRKEFSGFRSSLKRDIEDACKRAEQASAQAALAVQNADRAIHEAQETRQLLEHHADRVLHDFLQPMQDIARSNMALTTRLSEVAVHLQHFEESLKEVRRKMDERG